MSDQRKVEHLVVDTTAFIKNANLQDLANNVYTVQGVLDEIINKRQLRNLVVLPYDLKIKDVFPENIKFVTEFSKKTGDYRSLSAVDIQVMGLAYQLEKEHVGSQHLRSEPVVLKVDRLSQQVTAEQLGIAGFYMPPDKNIAENIDGEKTVDAEQSSNLDPDNHQGDVENDFVIIEGNKSERVACAGTMPQQEKSLNVTPKIAADVEIEQMKKEPEVDIEGGRLREVEEEQAMQELEEALRNTDLEDQTAAWSAEEEAAVSSDLEEEGSDEDEDMWDDNAWITPENVDEAKKDMKTSEADESPAKVVCVTSDFAMQNVIRQLGMKAMSVDGRIIKQLRTYILRCYSCFKTTSKMELLFCPHCGNRTLRKTGVLLKPDGTEEVMISSRKPPTSRGKRYSIPKPQGGKYAVNPILCPDQRLPQQFATKMARAKNNPLDPDYIAGYSPFVMRDVTSRSAVLGIRSTHTQVKNWMRRNPNEVVKKGKKRR